MYIFLFSEMELLHFQDDPGVAMANFDILLNANNAAFLQKCLSGLLVQEVSVAFTIKIN